MNIYFYLFLAFAIINSNPILPEITSEQLINLLQHDLGLLQELPKDLAIQEVIETHGIKNFLQSNLFNYVFAIETKDKQLFNFNEPTFELSNNEQLSTLINGIYNNDSIAFKFIESYGPNSTKFPYFYSTDIQYSVLPKFLQTQLIKARSYSDVMLTTWLNKILSPAFKISLTKNTIIRNSDKKEFSFKSNELKEFLLDIYSINELGRFLEKQNEPQLIVIHLASLVKAQEILGEQLAREVLLFTRERFMHFITKRFNFNEVQGEVLYIQPQGILPVVLMQMKSKLRALDDTETTSTAATGELQIDAVNFQIYVWLPFILAFVLLFSILALFTMNTEKDTLLYAKFITDANK